MVAATMAAVAIASKRTVVVSPVAVATEVAVEAVAVVVAEVITFSSCSRGG